MNTRTPEHLTAGSLDLAILGSGFSGSLLALIARRLGRSVLLLERGSHPRFAIGESTSPLANLLLEELATRYGLDRILPLAAYGTWKRAYPKLTVGLKRGFTFYHHTAGQPFAPDPGRERQLLVAASPYDEVADTHWYRAEFDQFLMEQAQDAGAEYVDRIQIERVQRDGDAWTLEGTRHGHSVRYRAAYLVDATGPRGALSRLMRLPEGRFAAMPPTQGLFSHFTGVGRFAEIAGMGGEPPYPPDDAALHHVFDGGWMWVLRFENGVTSAGFAMEDRLADEIGLPDREGAWKRLIARFPSIGAQFEEAEPVFPLVHAPRISYVAAGERGPGWTMLPSASAFIDPLYSTGFPLALLGVQRLAAALEDSSDPAALDRAAEAASAVGGSEVRRTALLVGGSYALFREFPSFAAFTMIYFAAASYAEMARRLDRGHLAPRYLLQGRRDYRHLLLRHWQAVRDGRFSPERLRADLEPFNIAGLCDPSKRSWYGVDLEDVVRGAAKLECTPEEVRTFIARMGW